MTHFPLAARMRPRSLSEFIGQEELVGEGRVLRRLLERKALTSMILWGPPGCGKTTLARLLAEEAGYLFAPLSAVSDGIARVRDRMTEAARLLEEEGIRTLLFLDEIHRFNRAQQDALLPHVESGTVVLVGATTENPSFEVVRALLSRAPVHLLRPLGSADIERLLARALGDHERGLGALALDPAPGVLAELAGWSGGDARRALGALEGAAALAGPGGVLTVEMAREAFRHRAPQYDRSGEEHYNLLSALHKSIRGSDPDAALYWLARMLEAGEDPAVLARRMVRMASEDIGLADPQALSVALAGRDAWDFLGSPEGELALAQVAVHLATSAKSNRLYLAWSRIRAVARDTCDLPVPMHLRNAPTALMRELGYGAGYQYDPDVEGGVSSQRFLPDALDSVPRYEPGPLGHEATIRKRLAWFEARRAAGSPGGDPG